MHYGLLLLFILVFALVPAFRKFLFWVVGICAFFIGLGALHDGAMPMAAQVLFICLLTCPVWLLAWWIIKRMADKAKRETVAAEQVAKVVERRKTYGAFKAKSR